MSTALDGSWACAADGGLISHPLCVSGLSSVGGGECPHDLKVFQLSVPTVRPPPNLKGHTILEPKTAIEGQALLRAQDFTNPAAKSHA